MEVRFQELTDIETRDDNLEISGYALRFNEPSVTLGGSEGFKEIIESRALDNVDMSNTHLYYQHDSNSMLANTKSGTMSLEVTNKGLYFRAQMADTTLGKDTYKLIKRGDLSAMSFGFTVNKDTWDVTQSPEVRTIKQIGRLDEISIVSRPAYETSSVSTRSKDFLGECRECRDLESLKKIESNKLLDEAKELLNSIKG